MGETANALAVVLAVNLMLWLGQVAVLELNPVGPVFYNCNESIIAQFGQNGCNTYVLNDTNPTAQLPTTGSTIQVDNTGGGGNFFTDTFSAGLNWITQSTGLGYLYNILAAPSNFLKAIGLPPQFSFGISFLWYGFTLFLIVSWLFGRDY